MLMAASAGLGLFLTECDYTIVRIVAIDRMIEKLTQVSWRREHYPGRSVYYHGIVEVANMI
jgi:hypothetical protein